MSSRRRTASRFAVTAALAVLAVLSAAVTAMAQSFPLGQVLVLDAPRIGSLKRVPVLTTESDGSATIDLWCKTVPGRLIVDGAALRIETAPLPEALPQYMSSGQCSDERMQADATFLESLTQVTGWQRRGQTIVFDGPATLTFHLSSH